MNMSMITHSHAVHLLVLVCLLLLTQIIPSLAYRMMHVKPAIYNRRSSQVNKRPYTSLQVSMSTAANNNGISPCVIKVIGVGGGGSNAIIRMIETGVSGVDFIAMNTDLQALARFGNSGIDIPLLNIGKDVTRGLGAGGIPDNGRKAAEESRGEIRKLIEGL